MALLKLFSERVEARPAAGVFEPAARSAFRVLGLAATAAQGEVFDAASSVRLALKLGVRKSFDGDAAWLFGPPGRGESDVRDAVGRLSEPARRARERLFWFHAAAPHAPAASVAELMRAAEALLAPVPADPAGAPLADAQAAALHDAALLALCGLVRLDPALGDAGAWRRAFGLWRRVLACEGFWSLLVAADLKGDYEQPVTFGEVEALRQSAPRIVSGHVAAFGGAAARRGRLPAAARALDLLRGAGLPAPLLQEYENELVGPAEDAAIEELDKAFAWVEGFDFIPRTDAARRNYCNEAWRRFDALRPRLGEFAGLAGADSYAARRVFENAAGHLLRLAASFEGAGRPQEALLVCRKAHALAPPGSEELDGAESKLRALGAAGEARGRNPDEYAAALAAGLADSRAPAKLFRDDPKGDRTVGSFSNKSDAPGCLTTVAFWLALAAACVGLRWCGVIKTRPTRTPVNALQPLNVRPNFNWNPGNLNYNIPPPVNLRLYADPPPKSTRQPGGRSRRQPQNLSTVVVPPTVVPGRRANSNANSNAPPRE